MISLTAAMETQDTILEQSVQLEQQVQGVLLVQQGCLGYLDQQDKQGLLGRWGIQG